MSVFMIGQRWTGLRIPEAVSPATLPPETTTATVAPSPPGSSRPGARRCRPLRPAPRPASRARRGTGIRLVDLPFGDEHGSTPRRGADLERQASPANGALRPSATDRGVDAARTSRPRGPRARRPSPPARRRRLRRSAGAPSAMPRDEAAAAHGHDDDLDVGEVLDDLEADRALAGHDERVVERVHEHPAGRLLQLAEALEDLGRPGAPPGRRSRRTRRPPHASARSRPAT